MNQVTPRKFVQFEKLRLRKLGTNDEWCYAEVALVSPNGRAMALLLEGVVRGGTGFITGVLALDVDLEAGRITGMPLGDEYEVQRRAGYA
jgi:hypothetical protein